MTDGSSTYTAGHVTISGQLRRLAVESDRMVELTITAQPILGWHVYAWAEQVPEIGISKPTLIVLDADCGFTPAPITTDNPVIEKKDDVLGGVIRHHKGPVTWTLPIRVPRGTPAGVYAVNGWVGFQACADDDSACDLPAAARFTVPLEIGDKTKLGPVDVSFAEVKYRDVEMAAKAQPSAD